MQLRVKGGGRVGAWLVEWVVGGLLLICRQTCPSCLGEASGWIGWWG